MGFFISAELLMETLILHYNYQRSLNNQYIHTKALANSAQQVTENQAGFFMKLR